MGTYEGYLLILKDIPASFLSLTWRIVSPGGRCSGRVALVALLPKRVAHRLYGPLTPCPSPARGRGESKFETTALSPLRARGE